MVSHLKSASVSLSDKQISLLIFFAGMALFTLGLQNHTFVGFETRFALFAKEMLRHGPSVFPTTYGEPYPDYPATATLLIYWLSLPFGDVGRLIAALPTALASALNLVLIYKLLAPLSRRWALLTVCFELLTFTFLAEARALSLDQMVTTVTLATFYLVYSADREQLRDRLRWLPILLLCGFALRGPLGLVIPAGVACSYYALSSQWRRMFITGGVALLLLAIAWIALLSLAALEGGKSFAAEVIRMQVSGRLEARSDLDRWYYFTSSFGNYALTFPIACLVLLLIAHRYPDRKHDPELALVFFLAGWAIVVVLGLSIPYTKKARYLLPIAPALAAIAAYPFVAQRDRWLTTLRRVLHYLLLMLPGITLIGLLIGHNSFTKKGGDLQLPWIAGTSALLLCQVAATILQVRMRFFRFREVGIALCAVAALWSGKVLLLEPALRQIYDTSAFVASVEKLRGKEPAPLAFYAVGKDARAIKYMVNLNYGFTPIFYNRATDFVGAGDMYIVAPSSRSAELSASGAGTPIFSGRFDNEDFSVFYRRNNGVLSAGKESTLPPIDVPPRGETPQS